MPPNKNTKACDVRKWEYTYTKHIHQHHNIHLARKKPARKPSRRQDLQTIH